MINDEASQSSTADQNAEALKVLEKSLEGYELPDTFTGVLIRPWMDVSYALLDAYGEESDQWRRMIWFSRIVCNAIQTSLRQRELDPLQRALDAFMTWLRVCSQESDSLDLAYVAAQYLSRRLRIQMTTDIEGVKASESLENASIQAVSVQPVIPADPEPMLAPMPGADLEIPIENGEISPENQYSWPLQQEKHTPKGVGAESEIEIVPEAGTQNVMTIEAETETVTETEKVRTDTMDIPSLSETFQGAVRSEQKVANMERGAEFGEKPVRSPARHSGPVPIGVWLGFHDQDISTMAKLAVYDRENDNYIFANKQGYLVRQLKSPELIQLIEQELVDIIERRLVTRKPG
jgi:hypothetical protein